VCYQPNLIPPVTTVESALSYKARLEELAPNVKFLMSLYLHPSITPSTIRAAKLAGITGVKSYPAGVTTNSASGVVDYESFYPVFAAMQEEDMVLNLHGESPPGEDITVLNAEEHFLPTLVDLHKRFPKLRICFEHCSTAAAIEIVKSSGPTLAATITPHHMFLTIDDVVGDPIHFCKPVAKNPSDRLALIRAVVSGNPKFFLGTDSAPHPLHAKRGGAGDVLGKCAAGVFTQPYATQLVLNALEQAIGKGYLERDDVNEDVLRKFLAESGRTFYRQEMSKERIKIIASNERVVEKLRFGSGDNVVVPFRRGEPTYSIKWV
jgi:dihydroorotase